MNKINIFDDIFSHQISSSDSKPTNFEYTKGNWSYDGITIFTDNHIKRNTVDRVSSKYKIGWLCESKGVVHYTKDEIINLSKKYNYIFTHDRGLIEYDPKKFLFVIPASWRKHFPDEHVNFYENKSKLISFAYSNKRSTKGHRYRHHISDKLGDKLDLMGTGTSKPFGQFERVLAYRDYMFTLIIENEDYDYYFSEKIMEPYWAGTVPIYWGGSHDDIQIEKIFGMDIKGIITFKDELELSNILEKLSPELYLSMIESVKKNYDIFTDKIYRIGSEEYFYEKYLHKYFEQGTLNNLESFVI